MCSSYHKRLENQKKIGKKREKKRIRRIHRLIKLKEFSTRHFVSVQINHKAVLPQIR